ncbi:hypothetical protein [Sphingopyxis sp.]|jgi:hypothetical protein|uniref:hypothetical protein n=1 Tax=Sphingopyxis sp. TaxID=1908224 RepID=UPI003F700D80
MSAPKSAAALKPPSQKAYDAYRNGKGKPRRPVDQIGSAELAELGVAIALDATAK